MNFNFHKRDTPENNEWGKTAVKKNKTGKSIFASRSFIGIVCIVLALIVCFGAAPVINRISDEKTEIVRMRNTVLKGTQLTENDIEVVSVGAYNLYEGVITDKSEVIGKYVTGDMYKGEYIFKEHITSDVNTANDILGSLNGEKKAISVTIGSFALGLSGKLETGDIISVIVFDSKDGYAHTPPELRYVRVITSTTSQGIDKADRTDNTQPVTVTVLVNKTQAELLAEYEKTSSMHFTLEYRGEIETAQHYLDIQEEYFKTQEG